MGVPQYHPGKVMDVYRSTDKKIVSSSASVQAMIRMWDGHTLVIDVATRIKTRIKNEDIILVDYYPSAKLREPVPKMEIVKIIRGELAMRLTNEYKSYLSRIRRKDVKEANENGVDLAHGKYIG